MVTLYPPTAIPILGGITTVPLPPESSLIEMILDQSIQFSAVYIVHIVNFRRVKGVCVAAGGWREDCGTTNVCFPDAKSTAELMAGCFNSQGDTSSAQGE